MKQIYKVLLLGLIVRLIPLIYIAFTNPDGVLFFDSFGYLNLADNLMEHGVFSKAYGDLPLIPDISRTPVFPLFLAGLKLISHNVIWISIVLLIVGALNVLLTYKLAINFVNKDKIALLAALLVALDIPSILFSSIVLSETLFTFLLLLGLLQFSRYEVSMKNVLFGGVIFSLMILCRPIGIFVPIVIILWLLIRKISIKKVAVLALCSYFLVLVWGIRNYAHFQVFTISSVPSINLYFFVASSIKADAENISNNEASSILMSELTNSYRWQNDESDAIPLLTYCKEKGLTYVKNHPLIFLKHSAVGVVYFFGKPIRNYIDVYLGIEREANSAAFETNIGRDPMNKLMTQTSSLTLALVIVQLLFSLLIAVGTLFAFLKYDQKKRLVLYLAVIAGFAILSTIGEVDGRFRIPVLPLLAIIAAIGFSSLWPAKFERQ